jgi:alkyl hydroperoxide reductase subunit AhpC
MSLRLGDTAPDFVQDSTEGTIRFHEWAGDSWVVLFSHPADFTPVCTTELGKTAALSGEFAKRGVKPIAVSADRKVATLYDMIHPSSLANATVRSVFIIDPKKVIRTTLTYPASTGRNFDEILRVIDSLQLTDNHKVATPANWKQGDEVVIVPSITDPKELAERFPQGFRAVRPYLRLTPQPGSKA